ncbi:phage tail protein [Acidaminococcus fermentans]|uniref:Phage tail protein n=1 Tax=Acidaminococcus fermentans TaxID=905 RepID=A0A6N7W1P7_ACIFE|nr:phage tail protein [Acidaminococcus fermentans]MSS82372.1 phage tail protein [Acidaminococcus fermentans]
MLIGFLDQTPFTVSSHTIRTFDDYSRSGTGRWAKHDLIGQKPKLEFLGPDIEKISFKMRLRADQGISPKQELRRLRKLRDQGQVVSLVLGFKPVGTGFWIIESLDETVKYWTKYGHIYCAEVSVTMQEYDSEVDTKWPVKYLS